MISKVAVGFMSDYLNSREDVIYLIYIPREVFNFKAAKLRCRCQLYAQINLYIKFYKFKFGFYSIYSLTCVHKLHTIRISGSISQKCFNSEWHNLEALILTGQIRVISNKYLKEITL